MPRRLLKVEVNQGPLRLLCYLIVKSILDLLIIGIFAIGFYYSAFNPYYRGSLDEAGPQWVRGWVVDLSRPERQVEVQLYIDGQFRESRPADFPHPNLVTVGLTKDERHGFFFYTPPLEKGEHEARVYAAYASREGERRTLELIGKPLRFHVEDVPAEPFFRGWLDEASAQSVRGWAISRDVPDARVEVELYVDGRFVESRAADYTRPDLKALRLSEDERHGFLFLMPALVSGEHEARVYAVRRQEGVEGRELRLIGRPIKFTVAPNAPPPARVDVTQEELRP